MAVRNAWKYFKVIWKTPGILFSLSLENALSWFGYLSGAKCKWFAYGPANAVVTPSIMVLPFWYQLAQVALDKRSLTG